MPTEFPNKNNKRRRYRTRMFDNRFSFPTTSEQVRQLQAESDAEGRSVASLVREAIDEFLPRLRGRRRKRQRTPLEPPFSVVSVFSSCLFTGVVAPTTWNLLLVLNYMKV